jgi:hypothetical protein
MPVSSSNWESYPWKNELALQLERVLAHCAEIMDKDFEGPHNPHHMLERALVLCAFCVRRMVEKRLVTDKFARTKFEVRTFQAAMDGGFRMPFHYSAGGAGGGFFRNYEIANPKMVCVKPKGLADEIIHSSQLMLIYGEAAIADGILISSDWHLKDRILHLTFVEFGVFARSVLDDFVRSTSDQWDPDTGSVSSVRE